MIARILLPVVACVVASHPTWAQTFTDVTAAAGLRYSQNSSTHSGDVPWMSGGAAAGDYDGDGWVDLFVTRFDRPDILYRNLGDGTFRDVSFKAGFTNTAATNGATWGDIENDGDLDLYLTSYNEPQFYLYVNDGQGSFREEAVIRGADVPTTEVRSGFSATMGDYDNDGYLDIHTTDWNFRQPGRGGRYQDVARLLHNRGQVAPGNFEDVTAAAGLELDAVQGVNRQGTPLEGIFSFASRFVDMDYDGNVDLLIAGDFSTSRLFWNNGDGTFSDGTATAGVGTDENGMGSAVGDFDGDGLLDWFVSSIFDPVDRCGSANSNCAWGFTGNRLFRNEGGREFSDQTDAAGVRDGGWGWGTAFFDYDNDSDEDLIMTNGVRFPQTSTDAPFHNDVMRLWRNDGGFFVEVGAEEGIADRGSGKGLLTFDYDIDGDLDVFVVNNSGEPVLYRNNTDGAGHWLEVDVVGTLANRDGLGAVVIVDPDSAAVGDEIHRQINAGSHFLGQSSKTAHFGLGQRSQIDKVSVIWPGGTSQDMFDVPPNQRLTFVQVPEPTARLSLLIAVSFGLMCFLRKL